MKNRPLLPLLAALSLLAAPDASAQSAALHGAFEVRASKPPTRDCGALPETFAGAAFVGDGDTIYGQDFPHGIRLWGIQAPELRDGAKDETVAGMRARAALDDLMAVTHHKVRCVPRKFDAYCRIVADCSAGPTDLSLSMLRLGMAYGFWLADARPDETARAQAYAAAEGEARRERRGLWKVWLGED